MMGLKIELSVLVGADLYVEDDFRFANAAGADASEAAAEEFSRTLLGRNWLTMAACKTVFVAATVALVACGDSSEDGGRPEELSATMAQLNAACDGFLAAEQRCGDAADSEAGCLAELSVRRYFVGTFFEELATCLAVVDCSQWPVRRCTELATHLAAPKEWLDDPLVETCTSKFGQCSDSDDGFCSTLGLVAADYRGLLEGCLSKPCSDVMTCVRAALDPDNRPLEDGAAVRPSTSQTSDAYVAGLPLCARAMHKWETCRLTARETSMAAAAIPEAVTLTVPCTDSAEFSVRDGAGPRTVTVAFRSWSESYLDCTPDPSTCLCDDPDYFLDPSLFKD